MSAQPSVVRVPLRWSDMDAFGHVNNATFLTLFEEARVAAVQEWFGDLEMLAAGIVVLRQEIDYLAQLVHRTEPVEVVVWCSHIGASSFDVAYEMRDHEGGTTFARAEATLVRFDPAAGHSCRLTQEQRAVLEAHLGEPVALFSRKKARR